MTFASAYIIQMIMANITVSLNPPQSSHNFENLVKDCLNAYGACFNIYGTSGQNQYGIDLYDTSSRAVCQCKNYLCSKLDASALKADLKKAVEHFPNLTCFIVATTAKPDAKIDDLIRSSGQAYDIKIPMIYWNDIERMLYANKQIIRKYYAAELCGYCTDGLVRSFLLIVNRYDLWNVLNENDFQAPFNIKAPYVLMVSAALSGKGIWGAF